MRRPPRPIRLCCVACLVLATASRAQVVERNLPPAPQAAAPAAPPSAATAPDADATPIGPPVAGIVALGPADPLRVGATGVVLAGVPRIATPRGAAALRRFLGRPISRRLIAEIAAELTRLQRCAGYPFVSVTTPPQEITSGVLQFRIVEYRAGAVRATGTQRAAGVERRVRLKRGDPIAATALAEDLDWLNRTPARQVTAQFAPGAEPATSDVTLVVMERRPLRFYAGLAQSGSAATGRARYYAGIQAAGLPLLPDALLSYQFTGSRDAFGRDARYLSHAARASLPFAPRRAIELTYDHVATNQPVQDFVVRQIVDEAALGYRTALSELPGARHHLPGDVSLAVEARRATRHLLFGDVDIQRARIDVVQCYLGYTLATSDAHGGSTLALTLHASPGGIDRDNRAAAFAQYSNGRSATARYAYLNGQASRYLRLGRGFGLETELLFQYAHAALPETEQIAIGGGSLVRGYSLDDGAFDAAAVLRTELRLPATSLAPRALRIADALQPRLFVDAGHGYARRLGRSVTAVSTGVGADYRVGTLLAFGVDAAYAFKSAPYTRAGSARVETRLTLSY